MNKKLNFLLFLFLLVSTVFAKTTIIDIISFNDFHGNVAEDTREKGKNIGMAKMVGYVNEARKANPNTIVVSGGDNYQGTAISNLTFGVPVTKMMKAMKLTASAVGNHEFDWGSERIANWAKDGNFDYLAANIYDAKTNKPVSWAKPYKIVELDGTKIALIGLSTIQTAYQSKAEFVKDIKFIPADEAAKEWIKYLKDGKDPLGKPDVIVAITHIPSDQKDDKTITGEELDKLTKVEDLDAVVTGHSHRTVSGVLNNKPVVQAYKYGRALAKLHIVLDDGKITKIEPSVDMVSDHKSDIIADENTAKELKEQTDSMSNVLDVKLGVLNEDVKHDRAGSLSELGYWSCDVMRKYAKAQVGLTNGGGLRRTLYKGNVTMGDMYEIMPFDNQVVVVKVTGKELKKLIDHGIGADYMTDGQFAGLKVIYDPNKEYEHRITKITLEDGTPIKDDEVYTVATNDFIVGGGDRYDFKNAIEIKDLFVPIRDVLVENVKANNGIKVPNISGILVAEKSTENKKVEIANNEKKFYIVKKNDNLSKISKEYNVPLNKLIEVNKIKNPNIIYVGKKLLIPAI